MFGNNSIASSWGQPQQQPQQPQAAPPFGQPAAPGFGTGTFSSGGAFGQQQPPQANPMFGGLGGTAGTSSTTPATTGFGTFGANNQPGSAAGLFGAPKPATGFGAFGNGGTGTTTFGSTGAFGSNTANTSAGPGLFGQPNNASTSASTFGGGSLFAPKPAGSTFSSTATPTNPNTAPFDNVPPVTTGSSNPPYNPFTEKDPATNSNITLQYQSISCMPAYRGCSLEEIRWQDYQQGRKTAGAFGQSTFGAPAAQPTTGTGLFGQPAAPTTAQPTNTSFGSFGNSNTAATTAGTGAFGTFGQPAASTTTPATGGGLFGGGGFGQQPQPQPQQQTGGFGAFGQPQQQPAAGGLFGGGGSGGAFGAQNQQPKPFGAFGATGNTGTTGTTGGFGAFGQPNQPQPAATGTGLFGQPQQPQQQQPQQPNNGFGAFGANNQQKPPLFGQPQQQGPNTFGAFGGANTQPNQQQGTQSASGLFGSTNPAGGGLFSNTQQNQQPGQQQPAASGLFSGNQPAQPTAGGLFGNPNSNTGGGLFGNTQANQQNPAQPATGGFGHFGQPKPATITTPAASGGLFGGFGTQNATNMTAQPQQQSSGLFGSTLGQANTQPASSGFGLFGKPATAMQPQPAGNSFGGSIFGSTIGAPTGQPAAQQHQLTASIAQPIGANLPIFSMLPPGPRAITLDPPRKKSNIFLEVPTRAPVPRIQLGYTPAASKLRGYTSTSTGQAQGFGASVSLTSGKPGALALSQRSLLGPDAILNGTGPSPGLGSSTRQSVKKLILDKKVEPADLMKSGASKSMFNPALSIAAREYEAAMAQRQETPTPASKAPVKSITNKFSAQPTNDSVKEAEKAPEVSELKEGDYYVKPSLPELKKYSFGELSAVKGLIVGRAGYGEIEFLEPVDLTGLRRTTELLGDIVRFDDKECSVYPDLDDADKPPSGSGLNVRASITLVHCWALDKATREPIKDEKHPHALKSGLNKLLQNGLGKAAVTEAEVELKAYWERNALHTPTVENFDLQWSFELLRLKCEAYTTMNDLDEDEDVERKLGEKMSEAGSTTPPDNRLVAPAALYLTAILEHVCEHILSNVSRVVARDSGRTVATVQDLSVALCEDASVYSMFRTMKVYDQIDALSKVQKPRRSKSLTKTTDRGSSSRASSPLNDSSSPPSSMRMPGHLARASFESAGSFASVFVGAGGSRSSKESHEKPRKKLLFGRSSIEQDEAPEVAEADDDSKRSNSFEMMDEEALREFDELMQSTTTMKVSLTPDRLKSMEVYKQERRRPKAAESDPYITTEAEVKRAVSVRRVQARLVDSITEDEEPVSLPIRPPPSPIQNPLITPRTRQASLNASALPPTPMSNSRARSVTISAPQPLQKRPSQTWMRPPVPLPLLQSAGAMPAKRQNSVPTLQSTPDGRPQRTRKPGRNRESLDLDEVMGMNERETETIPQTPSSRRDPSKPHISKAARDLIDFLDEGPPIELQPPNRNASMISLESHKSRSGGRLQRMMSKLTLGGSSEKLNGRSSMATEGRVYRSPSSSVTSSPPPPYLPSPTNRFRGSTVIVATPPPPLTSLPLTMSLSSFMTPEPAEIPTQQVNPPPTTSSRRISITRKPVPAWDETRDSLSVHSLPAGQPNEQPSSSRRHSPNRKSSSSKRASPLDAFPPVPTTVNVNGIVHDSDSEIVRTASLASSKRYTPIRTDYPSPSSPHSSSTAPPSPSPSPKQQSMRYVPAALVTDLASPTCLAYDASGAPQQSWPPTPLSTHREVPVLDAAAPINARRSSLLRSTSEKGVAAEPPIEPAFTAEQAQDLRRLLSVATTADECRLLVDMFLIKSGFSLPPTKDEVPAPAPSPEVEEAATKIEAFNSDMERSLVGLLLGDAE